MKLKMNINKNYMSIFYITMSIQFKTKQEVGIKLMTTVKDGDGSMLHIYSFINNDDCNIFFELPDRIQYIGYMENNDLYVINLLNNIFDEIFKSKFNFINDNDIILLSTEMKYLTREEKIEVKSLSDKLRMIDRFKLYRYGFNCINIIDLTKTKDVLNYLNNQLKCKEYKFSIDYVFNLKNDTEINAINYLGKSLLLCIFTNDVCVSSLVIQYDLNKNEIMIDSKTKINYEGKKLNKLLRAVIIIISKKLYPNAIYLSSSAINPISTYLMTHYFNAITYNSNEERIELKNFDEIKEFFRIEDGVETRVELNNDNILNAEHVFNNIITNEMKCDKIGGKKRSYNKRKNKRKSKRKYIINSRKSNRKKITIKRKK
jgi:hypothetical protein